MNGANNHQSESPSATAQPRVPWWMWIIIIACMIPGLSYPMVISLIDSTNPIVRGLAWFYPLYVLMSGFLAWQCYGRRSVMTWIILVLLILSHCCFYYMTFGNPAAF